ncbi:MAG: hypothetical protein AAGB97_00875 [Dehalococcoidia bacterium]|nr:hypothetical protein [Chloroflexota bacterium]
MRDRKKIAAIMAAIHEYRVTSHELRVGGEASKLQTPHSLHESRVQSRESRVTGRGENSELRTQNSKLEWRASGRQEIMQMRALWQRRLAGSR